MNMGVTVRMRRLDRRPVLTQDWSRPLSPACLVSIIFIFTGAHPQPPGSPGHCLQQELLAWLSKAFWTVLACRWTDEEIKAQRG